MLEKQSNLIKKIIVLLDNFLKKKNLLPPRFSPFFELGGVFFFLGAFLDQIEKI